MLILFHIQILMQLQTHPGKRPTQHLPNPDDDLRAVHALRGGQLPRKPVSQQLPRGRRHTGFARNGIEAIICDISLGVLFLSSSRLTSCSIRQISRYEYSYYGF